MARWPVASKRLNLVFQLLGDPTTAALSRASFTSPPRICSIPLEDMMKRLPHAARGNAKRHGPYDRLAIPPSSTTMALFFLPAFFLRALPNLPTFSFRKACLDRGMPAPCTSLVEQILAVTSRRVWCRRTGFHVSHLHRKHPERRSSLDRFLP